MPVLWSVGDFRKVYLRVPFLPCSSCFFSSSLTNDVVSAGPLAALFRELLLVFRELLPVFRDLLCSLSLIFFPVHSKIHLTVVHRSHHSLSFVLCLFLFSGRLSKTALISSQLEMQIVASGGCLVFDLVMDYGFAL